MSPTQRVLVVGIGSPHGDDSVGWYVARALSEQHIDAEHVQIQVAQIPVDLINWLGEVQELHLVDACRTSGTNLTWHRHEITKTDLEYGTLPFEFRHETGTHGWSLISVLQLALRLHMLPQRMVLWAIEADSFVPGTQLADSVRTAADRVVEQLRNTIVGQPGSLSRGPSHA